MKTEIVKEVKERVDKVGKRWIQDHEKVYDKAIKHYEEESESKNKSYIVQYLQDIRLGDRNKISSRRSVSKSRCLRIFGVLQNIDAWLGFKSFKDVTVEDMKKFIFNLKEDIILSPSTEKAYAETTKASMFKMVRKFWKWLKNTPYYPEEVDWIDTYEPRITKDVFSIEDVELVSNKMRNKQMYLITWLLFDGGFRIAELLNFRLKDIKEPANGERYFSIQVRSEIEKNSRERTVGLYYCNKELVEYLKNDHQTPGDSESFLFNVTYDHIRNYITRVSKKHLNRIITPHRLRASSATHFACKIKSYQSFCYRFGWSLSSRVPDSYYNRSAVKNRDVMDQIHSFERTRIICEQPENMITNKDLFDENNILQRKLSMYENEMYKRQKYDGLLNRLLQVPEIKNKARELMNLDFESLQRGTLQ